MSHSEPLPHEQYAYVRGQDSNLSKLTDMDVIDIRSAKRQRDKLLQHIKNNLSNKAMAERYNISVKTLEKVLCRHTWKHLP
jgi:hypothetical protein